MDFDNEAGQKPGLEIWRIENMKPVRVKKEDFGKFFGGDCYIVLNTVEKKGSIEQDLFFWIGDECSQDEKGAVAYQTVFLDDKLGGKPVQHREVQGHESNKFKSLFKDGIEVLNGGVASAFRHVDPNDYKPRLFHLKGKRTVCVLQVAQSRNSMNDGDVFILDKGLVIYQWNGSQANKYEKFKGLEITNKIRNDERGGKPEVVVLDAGVNDQKADDFWSVLGGYGPIKSADEGGSDDDSKGSEAAIFRVNGNNFDKVASGKLTRDMLDTTGVFVVDSGSEVFVYIGKQTSKDARAAGMKQAQAYLQSQGRPDWTPLTRIIETGETPAFKALFSVWDPPRVVSFDEKGPAAKEEVNIDVTTLYKQNREAEEKMADNGTGSIKIWRIENFDKTPLPEDQYGQFYMGDSYIMLYTYLVKGKPNYIIYFWQGRDSSTDEKGTSAYMAVQMDDELGGDPVQVRVVQGKEPNHFLTLFKGKMIVHKGGAASGFKNRLDVDSTNQTGISLYHVKGTTEMNTRAIEVDAFANSLNSGDCFVLLTPETMFVWNGKGSSDQERLVASHVAQILQGNRSAVQFNEGEESDDFWNALGGKADYPTSVTLASGAHDPRLFHCSNVSGRFRVDEVFDFSQDDLINDDVMLLDTFEAVYVWIGHNAMKEEKDGAMKVALDYVANSTDGRDPQCPIYKVIAGSEPPVFTCHFMGWNDSRANDFSDPYAKKLAELTGKGQVGTEHKAAPKPRVEHKLETVSADSIGFAKGTFSYDDLKNNRAPNIDPSAKQNYLSDAEFQTVFKMSKADFGKLPKWKQDATKKTAGLF